MRGCPRDRAGCCSCGRGSGIPFLAFRRLPRALIGDALTALCGVRAEALAARRVPRTLVGVALAALCVTRAVALATVPPC